jgi:hypothetical protein
MANRDAQAVVGRTFGVSDACSLMSAFWAEAVAPRDQSIVAHLLYISYLSVEASVCSPNGAASPPYPLNLGPEMPTPAAAATLDLQTTTLRYLVDCMPLTSMKHKNKNTNSRSRRGCIDCRKAKVKCDEVHPGCGTCHRRGYVCRGYVRADYKSQSLSTGAPVLTHATDRSQYDASDLSNCHVMTETAIFTPPCAEIPLPTCGGDALTEWNSASGSSITVIQRCKSVDESVKPNLPPLCLISLSCLPPGTISDYDANVIKIYFSRHPATLVIGPEFVDEMKSNMFQVFYNHPQAICDSLSAIGHNYLGDNSTPTLVPVLSRKGRILARLRAMDGVEHDLEKTIVLLIGLCTLEVSSLLLL